MWNDPEFTNPSHYIPGGSMRGSGSYYISTEDTLKFMKQNDLDIIVRSHEPMINKEFKFNKSSKKVVNIGSTSAYETESRCFILPDNKIYEIN